MRFAFIQICLGAALVLVGLHLAFMAYDLGRHGAAAFALFGAVVGVFLVFSGDREWQDLLDEEEGAHVERQ
ncbi:MULTISPECIES: hypothetical protein [unclassified Variovorax]|uniref:hypothetical protein n=1 Tax=unclassified Variovorax TaxID=663243 RepID=UPI003F452CD8